MTEINMDTELLINFVNDLKQEVGFDKCFEILTKYTETLGFDGALYYYVSLVLHEEPIIKFSAHYDENHIEYHKNNQPTKDPLITANNIHSDVVCWCRDNIKNTSNRSTLKFLDNQSSVSVENGVSCRALLSHNAYAGVSVICRKDQAFFQKTCLPNIVTLQMLTHFFYSKMESNNYNHQIFIAPLIPQLNNTKICVLKGLARGQKPKVIAGDLDLSVKYVQNLLGVLRCEFGCKTTEQLMYIAGIIQLEKNVYLTMKNTRESIQLTEEYYH